MSLPKIHVQFATVDVGGEKFDLRSITRLEQARIQKMVEAKAPADELEVALIGYATDLATDEVREWYDATPAWAVQELINQIQRISRLDEEAQKSGG